eukprot:TRINITY_DN47375_c0_g1_i1.p1 TRINITY_DN47375_c0_g1~~TRINITY_DN47375_c0_g1_i1.p1  ORF type:complete len:415 (-),score=51.35 TRINITY_DN47375_c0_g1_i1:123-1367(-)
MELLPRCRGAASRPGLPMRCQEPGKLKCTSPWSEHCPFLVEALVTQTKRPSSAAGRCRSTEAGKVIRCASESLTAVQRKTAIRQDMRKMPEVKNLLTSVGYDFLFEEGLEQESVTSSLAKLRDFEMARGLSRTAFLDMESELIAGTCRLKFDQQGGLRRQITVHALQLRRMSDNHVMMHVGTWTKKRGMRATCFLPGGKQEVGLGSDASVKRLIRNELSWLLHDYHVKLTKHDPCVWTQPSDRYGTSTTYERIVFEGLAWKRTDSEDDVDVEEMESSYAPLVVEFQTPGPAPSSTGISSEEAQGPEGICLESTPVLGVLRSMTEVALYAWIHPDLWAATQSEKTKSSERMKAWARSFTEVIESYTEGLDFVERYRHHRRIERYKDVDQLKASQLPSTSKQIGRESLRQRLAWSV